MKYTSNVDYQVCDEIVNKLFINIYSLSKDKPAIIIKDFDPSNKTCLLFFEVALLSGNTFGKQVKLQCNWFKYCWFKLFNRKKSFSRASKKDVNTISWKEIMSWMKEQLNIDERLYSFIFQSYYNIL